MLGLKIICGEVSMFSECILFNELVCAWQQISLVKTEHSSVTSVNTTVLLASVFNLHYSMVTLCLASSTRDSLLQPYGDS